ncbi:hypothetical protein HAHE_39530 [Haloferula helveola]|uniref:General secretion pathway GspH domain-containing protein n=1 Tax=Haloferula helveola TaxID=490095 RepID=A0ABN6HGY1_9BACT|nr:hypothetical protein HAHE_39530 [Haloferula helveola]
MVIVLSLAMLIVGIGVGALYFNRDERRLSDAVGEIEVLAKRARSIATLQQKPYALEFTYDGVRLMPFGEALLDNDVREQIREAEELAEFEGESADLPVVRDAWQPDPDMLLLVRRWADGEWSEINRNDRQIWRFDPQGISEPCGVRLELENGNWIAVLFHPLTASIAETESEIR